MTDTTTTPNTTTTTATNAATTTGGGDSGYMRARGVTQIRRLNPSAPRDREFDQGGRVVNFLAGRALVLMRIRALVVVVVVDVVVAGGRWGCWGRSEDFHDDLFIASG